MGGNLNALGLILVILLTGAVLARYGAWPRSLRHVVSGIAVTFGVLFVTICLTTVFWSEANNAHQELISSACLALLLVFTKPNRIRTIAALAVSLSTIAWSFHVLLLVGPNARYTGGPEWTKRSCRGVTLSRLKEVRSLFSEVAEDDNRVYPAGWLAESELGRMIPRNHLSSTRSQSVQINAFWHSALTGLYGKKYHELSLWYPGGRLKEGLQRLEFRPR